MDPFILLRWPLFWAKFWFKRLGPKKFWFGMGVGTVIAVILNYTI